MAARSWFIQLRAMLYKNILLKRRHWLMSCIELLLPLGVVMAMSIYTSGWVPEWRKAFGLARWASNQYIPPIPGFIELQYDDAFMPNGKLWQGWKRLEGSRRRVYVEGDQKFGQLVVWPDREEIRSLVNEELLEQLRRLTNRTYPVEFVSTKEAMGERFEESEREVGKYVAGIVFDDATRGISPSYTLRFPRFRVPRTHSNALFGELDRLPGEVHPLTESWCRQRLDGFSTDNQPSVNCQGNRYLYTGFSMLQHALDMVFIARAAGNENFTEPLVSVRAIPKPRELDNAYSVVMTLIQVFTAAFTLLYLFALSFLTVFMVNLLVTEKEKKLRSALQMAGLSDSVYWCSWFLIYIVLFASVGVGSAVGMKLTLFSRCDLSVLLILFLLTAVALTLFGFLLSTLFDRADTSAIGSLFILLAFRVLYVVVVTADLPDWLDTLSSFTVSVPFGITLHRILLQELARQSITLDNIGNVPVEGEMSILGAFIQLGYNSLLYALLAYYLDKVLPKEHGARQSPLFFLYPSFWRGSVLHKIGGKEADLKGMFQDGGDGATTTTTSGDNPCLSMADVERVPAGLEVGVDIRHLSKRFVRNGKAVKAVDDLSAMIYQGEITAIIGHNGAGKTTLANVLIGMTEPSSGGAKILGLDIGHEAGEIRAQLGVCPQHDVLWDILTVEEHLQVFGLLKGMWPISAAKKAGSALLDEMEMGDKRRRLAKELSGGERRKLSVACALIGGPRVVFLDEPSSGVDPYSRRQLWTVLRAHKRQGRVIVITTHFMFEADLLADRKLVVERGRVRAAGSSLFLKNRFGLGYQLSIQLLPIPSNNGRVQLIADKDLMTIIRSHISQAQLRSSVRHADSGEIVVDLPKGERARFPLLFLELESTDARSRGVGDIGLSMSTLEEVFLSLAEANEQQLGDAKDGSAVPPLMSNGKAAVGDSNALRAQFRGGGGTLAEDEGGTSPPPASLDTDPKDGDVAITAVETPDNGDALVALTKHERGEPSFLRSLVAMTWTRLIMCARKPIRLAIRNLVPIGMIIGSLYLYRLTVQLSGEDAIASLSPPPLDFATLPPQTISDARPLLFSTAEARAAPPYLLASATSHWQRSPGYDALFNESATQVYIGGVDVIELSPDAALASNGDKRWRILYNDSHSHSLPMLANMLDTALLRAVSGSNSAHITTRSQPYFFSNMAPTNASGIDGQQRISFLIYEAAAFAYSLAVAAAFQLIAGVFSAEVVTDVESGVASMLRLAGASHTLQFFSFAYYHGIAYYLAPFIALVVITLYMPLFQNAVVIFCIIVSVALHAKAMLAVSYCASFIYSRPQRAVVLQTILYLVVGALLAAVLILAQLVASELDTLQGTESQLESQFRMADFWLCLALPPLPLMLELFYIGRLHAKETVLVPEGGVGDVSLSNFLAWHQNISACWLANALHILLLPWFLMLLDTIIYNVRTPLFGLVSRPPKPDNSDKINGEDEQVELERQRADEAASAAAPDSATVLNVSGLRKEYRRRRGITSLIDGSQSTSTNVVAVRNSSFQVARGELFGLLGPNGAGKTSTIAVIAGLENATRGRVQIDAHDTYGEAREAYRQVGYCAQFDGLWASATPREHLEMYALLRGLTSSAARRRVSDALLRHMGIYEEQARGKRAADLSGGTRRKLAFLISMVGSGAAERWFDLLDEPSTGMDPLSKRRLWNVIKAYFSTTSGQAAILTTHAMEEAEALCTRIAIMTSGQVRAIGSVSQLKNRYGSGYLLELKIPLDMSGERLEALRDHVVKSFPNAKPSGGQSGNNSNSSRNNNKALKAAQFGRLSYTMPRASALPLSRAIDTLERTRDLYGVDEYMLTQSSLEQVFLRFAGSSSTSSDFGE